MSVRTHALKHDTSTGDNLPQENPYLDGGKEGVKLEEMVLITGDGARRLSNYAFEEDFL